MFIWHWFYASSQALGIRRDDTFSTTMLNNVIEALMIEMSPYDGTYFMFPHAKHAIGAYRQHSKGDLDVHTYVNRC